MAESSEDSKLKEKKESKKNNEVEEIQDEEEDFDEEKEEFAEELISEWINRSGRIVDFSVSELESGLERPITQIRLEQAMENVSFSLGEKYAPSHGYESGNSYESKSVYSPAQESRAPVFDQAHSDFFRTPNIVASPQNQQAQGWSSQQNQQVEQAEEERRKQNRRF